MSNTTDLLRCDGCGAEIRLAPVVAGERRYCCEDCAQGRPCLCGEQQDRDEERRTPGSDNPIGLLT